MRAQSTISPVVLPINREDDVETILRFPSPTYTESINAHGATTSTISIFLSGVPVASVETTENAKPKIFSVHTDYLHSTRALTDVHGFIIEISDYAPFGSLSGSGDNKSLHERRKFTSHELDTSTNYTYAKARYLNTDIGKFISEDPAFWSLPPDIISDPQQMNSYAYARNNPVRYIDPDGKLNIVIAGTWGKGWENWQGNEAMSSFVNSVADTFGSAGGGIGKTWVEAVPELRDNKVSRAAVADRIAGRIGAYEFAPGETLNIVGHSHGGNVAALLSNMLDRPIDNLVTLGTPIRSDYQFNEGNIGNHVNAYSQGDIIQAQGGGKFRGVGYILGLGGFSSCGVVCGALGLLIGNQTPYGEVGPALRRVEGAKNIDVTRQALGNMKTTHEHLWSRPAVWERIDTYMNE